MNELKYLRGLDSGEKLDPRDKIRATASRVGLGIPQVRRKIFYYQIVDISFSLFKFADEKDKKH